MIHTALIFKCAIFIVAYAQYARITDEHYSVHFAQESSSLQVTMDGTHKEFQSLTFSQDYTMMSWVQIQESPSPGWASIWKIEHGNAHAIYNRTPSLHYDPDGEWQFCAGTSNNEAECSYITMAGAYPYWVFAGVTAWGTGGYIEVYLIDWGGSSSSAQQSFSGTVLQFDTTSKVIIGASNDDQQYFWPKMQVLDLRYYTGSWLSTSAMENVISATSCYSECSHDCWGPGNYSCNTFLTLVDPKSGLTLDDSWNGYGYQYVNWGGSDSFLMGRTFDSDDTAFSGWFKKQNDQEQKIQLWRASNEDWAYEEAGCIVPGMAYRKSVGLFRHCHGDGDGLVNNQRWVEQAGNVTLNSWIFVIGSSCQSTPQLLSCTGTVSGGSMAWSASVGSSNSVKFDATIPDANLYVGGKWTDGPGAEFRDLRYWYTKCLEHSEMDAIINNLTCVSNCNVCGDPETCTECNPGYVLSAGTCLDGCSNGEYYLNGSWVTDCGSGQWEDVSDNSCQPCDPCCTDCYGSLDMDCTACSAGCYLQPDQVDTCLNTCPTGYFGGNGCEACHVSWATCNSAGDQGWLSCNSGYYQVHDGSCASLCPNNTVKDSQNVCQACHATCATCSNTGIQDCIACQSNYVMDDTNTCQQCHATCAACSNTGQQDCITCTSGYLVNTGACESECPSGYAPDSSNVCQTCHETCVTCSDTGPQNCIQCIDGWRRSDHETESSSCLCDIAIHENVTLALQFACLGSPFSQSSLAVSLKLAFVTETAQRADLTPPDLTQCLDITDLTGFQDTEVQSSINEDLNQAGVTALDNSQESSYSYSESNVEAYAERGYASSFNDAKLLTESGSGVILSSLDDVFWFNDLIQFNVFSYDVDHIVQTNDPLAGYILSIEPFYLDDKRGQGIDMQSLENNVTIVFDGLSLNTTLTYECVYLLSNYTWSTEGCQLFFLLSDEARCSCNHLSQFSLREFTSSAQVDSNIEATVDVNNLKNIDIKSSLAPIVCLGSLYTLYAVLLCIFAKLDKATASIRKATFQRQRTQFLRRQTSQLVSQSSLGADNIERNASNVASQSSNSQTEQRHSVQAFQEEMIGQMAFVDIEQQNIAQVYEEIKPEVTYDLKTGDTYEVKKGRRPPILNCESANMEVKSINTDLLSCKSDQELSVDGLHREPDVEDQSPEAKVEDDTPKPRPTFKSAFLEKHQVFGMLFVKQGLVSRAERLTIVLVLLMTELFAIGLFYDSDRDPDKEETEDDKTVEQTVEGFGWRDFWILIYTLVIIIPIPIILKNLFTRTELDPEAEIEETRKVKKCNSIKRVIGYIISFCACAWCTWSIIMFSIEFGHNTSQIWLINFAITTTSDVLFKDVLIAAISVFFVLYVPMIKEKCQKRQNRYKIGSVDREIGIIKPKGYNESVHLD